MNRYMYMYAVVTHLKRIEKYLDKGQCNFALQGELDELRVLDFRLRAVSERLTGGTVPLSKTLYPLFSTGSTKENGKLSNHD